MKTQRRNRLVMLAFIVIGAGVSVSLALNALNENINLFYEPEQIVRGEAPVGQLIRAGGMVKADSISRSTTDLKVTFVATDMRGSEITMQYEGVLPDLFREGQGVIAKGRLNEQGLFVAEEVLAKHDENYMPPEIADTLAKAHKEGEMGESSVDKDVVDTLEEGATTL
ncbi:MAG: cytochrome c maturation protein CcmE [Pseudomonadales bacterium]|nr:cytochrome c maturation protein CcmE [Pseudomonadales bacterium]